MALTVQGLTKSFGGERALDRVDLELREGEIHALLGPNGSGKSTLIGCLSGRLSPEAGEMSVAGRPVSRFSPREAFAAGIAVIYQHFSLVPTLSVADNVFLGTELRSLSRIDRRRQRALARERLESLGASIDVNVKVSSLSVGERQMVEIAKALRHEPSVLILDEPTAALSETEAKALGAQLTRLRGSGLAILYVTHLLGEVFELADRVTVLRDGRTALHENVGDVSEGEVIRAISPRGGVEKRDRSSQEAAVAEPRLSLVRFRAPGIGPVSFEVGKGEVVGLFGMLGSGRSELLEGLYGMGKWTDGAVVLDGEDYQPRSAAHALRRGLALVPADRSTQSIFPTLSASDNLLLPSFSRLGSGLIRNPRTERRTFAQAAEELRLDPPRARAQARTFSGGNQQKLVVGRWLIDVAATGLLMLDEPTQGIDIGARADMYHLIRQFAADGQRAAVFTSADPEEVEALADRVLVLSRGEIVAELRGSDIEGQTMLEWAHGSRAGSDTNGRNNEKP